MFLAKGRDQNLQVTSADMIPARCIYQSSSPPDRPASAVPTRMTFIAVDGCVVFVKLLCACQRRGTVSSHTISHLNLLHHHRPQRLLPVLHKVVSFLYSMPFVFYFLCVLSCKFFYILCIFSIKL